MTNEINFHAGNVWLHKGSPLVLAGGEKVTYGQGQRGWEVRKTVVEEWWWGDLLLETNDIITLCFWLNSRQAGR